MTLADIEAARVQKVLHDICGDEPPTFETLRELCFRRLITTGDAVVALLDYLSVLPPDLRSHEPPRNSGEGTAVNGPMPLREKDEASESS